MRVSNSNLLTSVYCSASYYNLLELPFCLVSGEPNFISVTKGYLGVRRRSEDDVCWQTGESILNIDNEGNGDNHYGCKEDMEEITAIDYPEGVKAVSPNKHHTRKFKRNATSEGCVLSNDQNVA